MNVGAGAICVRQYVPATNGTRLYHFASAPIHRSDLLRMDLLRHNRSTTCPRNKSIQWSLSLSRCKHLVVRIIAASVRFDRMRPDFKFETACRRLQKWHYIYDPENRRILVRCLVFGFATQTTSCPLRPTVSLASDSLRKFFTHIFLC